MSEVRVAIVEDHGEIREGLAALIGGAGDLRLIGSWGSMEDALAAFASRTPDVALLDIGLPGMSGIEGARIVRQRHPAVHVVMLTVYEDDDRIFEALCAGAGGYVLKNSPPERLLESLREAASGGSPLSPEIARKVVEMFRRFRPRQEEGCDLTAHETRLLRMLVEGHNYTTAARTLGVSVNTVAFHMKRVYEKLQVHSKSEAVSKALRSGLIR